MPDSEKMSNSASKNLIIRRIIFLFGVLIAAVICTGVYSTFKENRRSKQEVARELGQKLDIAKSLQNNEIEKLRIISGLVREQNKKFSDFLDYERFASITSMIKTIGHLHNLDLVLFFSAEGELLTSSRTGTHVFGSRKSHEKLLGEGKEKTGMDSVPAVLIQQQYPGREYPLSG